MVASTVAAGALLACAAPAVAAPIQLGVEQMPTRVAAWNGTAMWSHYDLATRTYTLVKSVDGAAPVAVGVAPRARTPFDIDLGTNRSGATFAVYTRNGDIYRLNVASGAETKVAKLSSPTRAERDPTIMRGEIAFIRRNRGADELRIGNTTSGAKGSRLLVRRPEIVMAELGASEIAYVTTGPGPVSDRGAKYVRLRHIVSGRDRQIYKAVSGGANYADITRPSFILKPAGFLWARTNDGSGAGNRIIRYTLRDGRYVHARGTFRYNSSAWVSDELGAIVASTGLGGRERSESSERDIACREPLGSCTVALTGPLTFNLDP